MYLFEALDILTQPAERRITQTNHIQPGQNTTKSHNAVKRPAYIVPKSVAKPAWPEDSAKVLWVTDGDTFTCMFKGDKITVIIAGINAPEPATEKKQRYSTEAKQTLETLIKGKIIFIEPVDKDKYGRIIANAYFDNTKKQSISEKMIKAGLAQYAVTNPQPPNLSM